MEKNLTDNYEKQIYIGRDLFLRYDQDMLIKKYKLKNDHAYLYLNYIGTEYRIRAQMVPSNIWPKASGKSAKNIQLL